MFYTIVRFDGLGLDDYRGVTFLNVLRGRGYGSGYVAGGEDKTRRDKDAE
jgi:hypothetical protein